jgi:glutamate carboxypeptidase
MARPTKRRVTFLLTCDEETGSHFSRDVVEEEGRRSIAALVLEPPIPGGIVKTGRKGVGEFELVCEANRLTPETIREPESAP